MVYECLLCNSFNFMFENIHNRLLIKIPLYQAFISPVLFPAQLIFQKVNRLPLNQEGGIVAFAKSVVIFHQPGQGYWSLSSHMAYDKSLGVLFKHISSGDSGEESVSITEKV